MIQLIDSSVPRVNSYSSSQSRSLLSEQPLPRTSRHTALYGRRDSCFIFSAWYNISSPLNPTETRRILDMVQKKERYTHTHIRNSNHSSAPQRGDQNHISNHHRNGRVSSFICFFFPLDPSKKEQKSFFFMIILECP